jgi:hypothetical protein
MHKIKPNIIFTFFIICLVIISGCTDNNDKGSNDINSISAQEFSEKIIQETNETTNTSIFQFQDLDAGDQVIIEDKISKIQFLNEFGFTQIEFIINTRLTSGDKISSMEFDFDGDLTNQFYVNDNVRIALTIKHVTFDLFEWHYDLEVYEEGWDQTSFINNGLNQILPQSAISKI